MNSEQQDLVKHGTIYVQNLVSDLVLIIHSDSVFKAGSSVNLL